MFRPRVIPALLLKDNGLVKTVKFEDPKYVGDPINTVKIFNDFEADELVFLDIEATNENRTISVELVKKIGEESFMPFAVGGGIKSIESIRDLLKSGAEKVVLNNVIFSSPELITEASKVFGTQSIIASIDVRLNEQKEYEVYKNCGKISTGISAIELAKKVEKLGAGEIIINSIDKDGTFEGYDLELINIVSNAVSIPVIALGGAGEMKDLKKAVVFGEASAVAAGSMFIFVGSNKSVLINYPDLEDLFEIFTC
jgi:imidazole glycerol-phosphate synthase subunit HisF